MKTIVEKEKNEREIQILKLQEQAESLRKELAKQRIERVKQFNIRNLKIVAKTGRFLLPLVVTTSIISGLAFGLGGGLPFYVDDIKMHRVYSLEYQTDSKPYMVKEFSTTTSFSPNELTILTPWEFQDNQYVRYKRVYNFDEVKDLKLLDAILEENFEYVSKNVKDYKEEKQVANSIVESEKNDYFFQASVHILDEEDILKAPESNSDNAVITTLDLVFGLLLGLVVMVEDDYDYSWEVKRVNNRYYAVVKGIKKKKKELTEINQKILTLSKGGEN